MMTKEVYIHDTHVFVRGIGASPMNVHDSGRGSLTLYLEDSYFQVHILVLNTSILKYHNML